METESIIHVEPIPKPHTIRDPELIDEYRALHRKCEVCASTEQVEIHHIKSRGSGGSDEHNNLIALCWIHHHHAHNDHTFKEVIRRVKGR